MKPLWILGKAIFAEDMGAIKLAITQNNMSWIEVGYVMGDLFVDRGGEGISLQSYIKDYSCSGPMFMYGSLQMVKACNRHCPRVQTYCNLEQFKCSYYYPRLSGWLLQQEYLMIPYGEIERKKNFLFNTLGDNDCIFVRPDDGFKTFTGQVLAKDTWKRDKGSLDSYELVPPETICIVARPINIEKEWRLIVGGEDCEQKVVAGSQYKVKDRLKELREVPQEILTFAQDVLSSVDYHPDPFWTLDICQTRDGDIRVLETGSLSCAGWYKSDPDAIVRTVSDYIDKEWEILYDY